MSAAVEIEITLPPETLKRIENISALKTEIPQAIKRGMDTALSIVRGRIQVGRLSGRGPYPVEEHRLGIVTQKLQRSLREVPAVITGDTITGAIGSNVFYGVLHEYGLTKTGVVRGTKGGGRSKPYTLNIPERAPVRTGVGENAEFIRGTIVGEVNKTLDEAAR